MGFDRRVSRRGFLRLPRPPGSAASRCLRIFWRPTSSWRRSPSRTRWRTTRTATGSSSYRDVFQHGRLVPLPVRAQRHAQLPAARLRQERRDRPDRADATATARRRISTATRPPQRWDPRGCQKGLALGRRIYGDRRVKGAMVRRGFQAVGRAGLPARRGRAAAGGAFRAARTPGIRVPFEKAYELHARALDEHRADLLAARTAPRGSAPQGYDPAMIEAMEGAGTRTLKLRGGMPLLGPIRIFGLVPLRQHAGAARREAARRRARAGQGRRALGLLLLAHRPAAGPSDGDRRADRRLRSLRRRARRSCCWSGA